MAGVRTAVKLAVCLFLFDVCFCPSSRAWERGTADKIVATALSSLHGDTAAFLQKNSSMFREGLRADPAVVRRYAGFTGFDNTGYAAKKLGGQIRLLQDLFPGERSPYMAYRLGILTGLVMDLNSPFATATSRRDRGLQARFMKDVEGRLQEMKYFPRPPREIRSPEAYARAAVERSAGWGGPVRSQYLTGKGYNAIVQRAAARFYNDAIHSVADVLYTVGSGGKGKVDETSRYDFYRDACSFYLHRGMKEEALASYRKMGELVSSSGAGQIDSLEGAVNRYELILQVLSLEDGMRAAGIEISRPVGERLMEPFLSAMSRLAKRYAESGEEDEARIALELCLRERYMPEWSLRNLRKLYGLDKLENLDVPENAWKIYLEANGFESMAGRAYTEGRLWAANNSFARAAALYSAIPDSARDLRKMSGTRVDQIIGRMRTIPPAALLSEELFQAGMKSMADGEVASAVRDLQQSQRWGPGEKAVDSALADAESLQLFIKGRDLYRAGKYDKGVKCFRKLTSRFPGSPFVGPSKKLIGLYEKRRELQAGKLLLLLKGAYESSFVGDKGTVFELCDEVLDSSPGKDLRDRAQLLIAVAWYQSNQKGYLKVEKVLRELMRHRVLKEDGGQLVLRKNIDFYFGLKDRFPEIDLSQLDKSLLKKIDLEGEGVESAEAGEAADAAIDRASDEVESARELVERGEGEDRDMGEARSLLDEAADRLDDARGRFNESVFEEAKELADESFEKAEAAREKAVEILEITGELKDEAGSKIEEAETAVSDAESALDALEGDAEKEFDELRSDLEDASDLLNDAKSLFENGDYEKAGETAVSATEKAEELKEKVETKADEY